MTVANDRQATAGSMIKSELVQRIAGQNPHLYQRDIENIVNAVLGEITAALARGDRVELRGFGAFSVKHRPARTGRNPRTGAHVSVDKKSVPLRIKSSAILCCCGMTRASKRSQSVTAERRPKPAKTLVM